MKKYLSMKNSNMFSDGFLADLSHPLMAWTQTKATKRIEVIARGAKGF
jgi:hypothetical protein